MYGSFVLPLFPCEIVYSNLSSMPFYSQQYISVQTETVSGILLIQIIDLVPQRMSCKITFLDTFRKIPK